MKTGSRMRCFDAVYCEHHIRSTCTGYGINRQITAKFGGGRVPTEFAEEHTTF
jgi:hypothetical protein